MHIGNYFTTASQSPQLSDLTLLRITDAEAVAMSRYLVQHDGLFLGSSSACNLVASVRLAKAIGKGSGRTIVTILCDSGSRHYSKVGYTTRSSDNTRTDELVLSLNALLCSFGESGSSAALILFSSRYLTTGMTRIWPTPASLLTSG